jgi:hypothetical protein
MSCRNFETIITELARGQMLEARVKEDALAHMESCKGCAARFADEQTLTAGLRAVAASTASAETPMRVEAALLSAFRQGTNAPVVAAHATAQTRPLRWLPWSIAAAAAVLIFSTFALPRLLSNNSRERALAGTNNIQPTLPSSPIIAPPDSTQDNPGTRPLEATVNPENESDVLPSLPRPNDRRRAFVQNAGLTNRQVRRANNFTPATNANEEIATEFLPLTYDGNMSQMDDGQVVRVELPRSALQSFGLPVNAERAGERVKADVLLGHDGVARAIRFVR